MAGGVAPELLKLHLHSTDMSIRMRRAQMFIAWVEIGFVYPAPVSLAQQGANCRKTKSLLQLSHDEYEFVVSEIYYCHVRTQQIRRAALCWVWAAAQMSIGARLDRNLVQLIAKMAYKARMEIKE